MEKVKSRYLILLVILSVTAGMVNFLSYDTFYEADAAVRTIKHIPLNIGKWHGQDMPLDSRVYDILETRSIINRNYVSNGHSVFLSLVYYPETKVDFHAPEGCLAGQGIQVDKSPRSIHFNYRGKRLRLDVNQLIRSHDGSNELIFYFYKAGRFVGRIYIKLRFSLALNKFGKEEKNGSLIRVSTPVSGDDYKSASIILTRFIEDLYPYLCKYL